MVVGAVRFSTRQQELKLMAKQNEGKYPVVDDLPPGAILVKEYAALENVGEPAIYNRYSRSIKAGKQPPFEIVIYFERNFVVIK